MRNALSVSRGAGMVVIRVVGMGNMICAPALNDFLEEERHAGFRQFLFDLKDCRGMDSTFMGCMVGLCSALKRDEEIRVTGEVEGEAVMRSEAGASVADANDELVPLDPKEALAELQRHLSRDRDEGHFVMAVNVSPENQELLNILGVDKFVSVRGEVDLSGLEVTPLPEKELPPDQRRQLILRAHEHLVEIDKRNEAQFGAFLRTLSSELAKDKKTE